MPWPTLARLAISATAGAALTLALAAPLVHARPPDDLIAHDAIDGPGDPGATVRRGLGGGETYIRCSAWVSVICWIDGGGDLGCTPGELETREGFPTGPFETVRVGADHLCARRADGEVVCWGLEPIL